MPTPTTKMKKTKQLDEDVNAKLIKLSRKYPDMCAEYLVEMHKIIDWAEIKLKNI